ncbi:MAG TPA: alpha/beta hydrolase [Alphaproteobacteria bacterium]|jgi:pimeloyl-ACP methyl ester carboxylesterase|nr:alpha/beta hydrolase [Alphaproteobacteria bacterium]
MSEAAVTAQEKVGSIATAPDRTIAYRRVDPAPGTRLPEVVFVGGYMSDMTGRKAEALALTCAARGQGFLRFDHYAHGTSSGSIEHGTIGGWADDAVAVLDRLTHGPLVIVGSSMGAWIMLLAALKRPERVHALLGVAAAPDFTEELVWKTYSREEQDKLMREGRIVETSPYGERPYIFTRELIEDGRRNLLLNPERMSGPIPITAPVRLIHGIADCDVPYKTSLRLAERLETPDVVVTLVKDADHRLSREQDLALIDATVMEMSGYAPAASSAASPAR